MGRRIGYLIGLVCLMAAPMLHADNLQIMLCEAGYACATATGTGTGTVQFNSSYGDFNVNIVTGVGSSAVPAGTLDLSTVNITPITSWSGGGTRSLQVWLSQTDNSLGSGGSQNWSAIATGQLLGPGAAVEYYAYQDNGNTFNGTGDLLYSNAQVGSGAFSFSGIGDASVTGPYSLTQEFVITLSAGGNLSSADGTLAPVAAPEPSSFTLIGTGIFGVIGLVRRRAQSK